VVTGTALVTGATAGIGAAFARRLAADGYDVLLVARDVARLDELAGRLRARHGVEAEPLPADLSTEAGQAAVAGRLSDPVAPVDLLINNAGGLVGASFLGDDIDDLRRELDVNLFGPLRVARAVVPLIEANGGGHVVNVASVLSWVALGGSYSASKAALWSMSNSLRSELAPRGIGVTTLHMGYVDTDMTAAVRAPKSDPADVVRQALDGVEAGEWEVLADDVSRQVKSGLAGDPRSLYAQLAASA
jgi:short-subunit dehydrogenase